MLGKGNFNSTDPAEVLHFTDERVTLSGFATKSCHGPQNPLPTETLPENTNNSKRNLCQ